MRYMGTMVVVNPEANPAKILPITISSTLWATRQVRKQMADSRNRKKQMSRDRFLES